MGFWKSFIQSQYDWLFGDELIKAEEVIEELKKQIPVKDPKEEFYNTKYPQSDVKYKRTEKDGEYEIDVRNFFQVYDSSIPVCLGTEQEKVLRALSWVIDNIKYTPDKTQYGYDEFWAYAYQTLNRKQGDCEDGAILLANMLIRSGIPYWKVRISAGDTPYGGHAYVTFYDEERDRWVSLDWCFFPNKLPIRDRLDYKEDKLYGDIWFSFNQKYAFNQNGTKLQFNKLQEVKNNGK